MLLRSVVARHSRQGRRRWACDGAVAWCILDPSNRVEFTIDLADLEAAVLWPVRVVGLRHDLGDINTLHLLRLLLRNPSEEDVVAGVPDVQQSKGDIGLRALAGDELSL